MLTEIAFAVLVLGTTCYLLFGGADFGAGLWHLLGSRQGGRDREVVDHAVGPVWEANHVWLIFVFVLAWTAFPPAFAAVAAAYWVPLSLAVFGIVVRGAAFAFHKAVPGRGAFAAAFGVASVLTPYCLGAVAGGVAAGRLGDWTSPTPVYAGLLTAGLCVYLAAVYLTADARRLAGMQTAERFRRRALLTGSLVGVLALAGPVVVRADAADLCRALLDRALPLVAVSGAAGVLSLGLLLWRRYAAVRVTAALAVATVLWGWVAARYPMVAPPALTIHDSAAADSVLRALLVALGIGAAIVVPSFGWLYALFQRHAAGEVTAGRRKEGTNGDHAGAG